MKYLLYLIALPAIAQTLTPAEPPTNWTELAIIGGIILLVVLAFLLHKRFPSASEKAAAEIHAEAVAMGHKALDLLHKHADAPAKPPTTTSKKEGYL